MLLLLLVACDGCTALEWDFDGDGFDYWTDCDDGDGGVSPDGEEVCNGLDDDCDGVVDDVAGPEPEEEEPDTGGCCTDFWVDESRGTWWFPDRDADGYGSADERVAACAQPEGFLDWGSDCDDADATVFPGAPDACGDGIDQECDGVAGECCGTPPRDLPEGTLTFVGDDSDATSWTLATIGDVDLDGVPDVLIGAPVTANAAGVAWVVPGSATGEIGPDDAIATIRGTEPMELVGVGVGGGLDWDGDGASDLLVARLADPADGQACLFRGPISGERGFGDADRCWSAEKQGGLAYRLDTSGDFDGDGAHDLLAAAPYGPAPGNNRVYVVPGGSPGGDVEALAAGELALVDGLAAAVGDVDGDGLDDLLARGAYGVEVRIARGPVEGVLGRGDLETLEGLEDGGFRLGPAGDVNGDGLLDAWVGRARGEESTGTGSVYVWHGPLVGTPALVLVGESAEARVAHAASPGDVDGDGRDDLVLGTEPDVDAASFLYVVTGAPEGVVDVSCLGTKLRDPRARGSLGAELAPIRPDGVGAGLVATAPGGVVGSAVWLTLDDLR